MRDKFKTVSRLLEAEEYEQLLASIKSELNPYSLSLSLSRAYTVTHIVCAIYIEERQLKQRITELTCYRMNGITGMEGQPVTHA